MSRTRVLFATALAAIACAVASAYAQAPPEVIVRPGDTIQWVLGSGSPPHKVRFGANGATPVTEVKQVLGNFSTDLTPAGDGPALTVGTPFTAKVLDTAEPGKTFIFTCGIHPPVMLSLQFTVAAKVPGQAARTHKIVGETGLHWHLHVDTTP